MKRIRFHSRLVLLVGMALTAAACGAKPAAPADPSVLVTVRPARQGVLPLTVEAFGTVGAPATAVRAISLQQAAVVTSLNVAPGAAVRAGQTLLTYAAAPEARAAAAQAQAAVDLAKAQQAHTADNFAHQLATRDDVARADAALQTAQAGLSALRQQGAGGSGAIVAPFDGVVISVTAATGDRPQPGTVLLTLAPGAGLVATVGVEPDAARQVHLGDAVAVQSLSSGASQSGRVLRVDNALNPASRMIDVDVSAPGVAPIVGEAVKASVPIGQAQGWIVPHAAVLNDEKGDYLFQLAGGKAVRIPVKVRAPSSTDDLVEGALNPSRPVIVDGAFQLTDGMSARIQAPTRQARP